jgi:hypothetical protein
VAKVAPMTERLPGLSDVDAKTGEAQLSLAGMAGPSLGLGESGQQQYLVHVVSKKAAAHLLRANDGENRDSYCRMYSTGGMRQAKYEISNTSGHRRICQMCQNVFEREKLWQSHG